MQHFDLLLKARVPEHISFFSFKESSSRAGISVSVRYWNPFYQFSHLLSLTKPRYLFLSQDLVKYNFFKEIQKIVPSLRGSFASEPEKLAEVRRIEQVAEHNRIALNIINQVGAGEPSLRVSFEFTHHPHFAVAVVKRSWFKFGIMCQFFTPLILIVIAENSRLRVAHMFIGFSERNTMCFRLYTNTL